MIYPSLVSLALVSLASSRGVPRPAERHEHAANQRRQDTGCGQTPSFSPGDYKNFTTTTDRQYRVWLPPNYDSSKETPLILSFHGASRDIAYQVDLDELTDTTFNEDYIVVYLQGLAVPAGSSSTKWEGAPGAESDDIQFTNDVLDTVTEEFCVDEKRIFATGKSQGGGFVGRLACDSGLSGRIAAFAPVSGAYYIKEIDVESECHPETVTVPCNASRADIPIMAFHGGADGTINYHGDFRSGACLPDVSNWAKQWAVRDGLSDTPANTTIPGSDNGVTMSYGDGLVTLVYDGDDIGHDWPSTVENADNDGETLAAFNATALIVKFFGEHTLP
ncbi:carbohydrate esterase family 1 protein [Hypoxylon sp. CI-4A]|nr:carbohydrate esterase family 1 protein [Hypoxylon sp. CI-4A]